jgi:phenylalanine-4-hydroxylase
MAVGKSIKSAFAGPASPVSFTDVYSISDKKTSKIVYSKSEQYLHALYDKVRALRTNKSSNQELMSKIFDEIQTKYPNEWLILLELLELAHIGNIELGDKIHTQLAKLKENKDLEQLICDGLELIKK